MAGNGGSRGGVRARLGWALGVALLLAVGGCGHHVGHEVGAGERHNLEVVNESRRTVHVYVVACRCELQRQTAAPLGSVRPGQVGRFRIHSGERMTVYLRERGSNVRERVASHRFRRDRVFTVTHS